ncbi:unnamed protein product [Calicophoron daubneyi]|uniref:FAM192A/Fyv6 N-terminal domain-containing protein n=1 Tax=Calicophoron daubneyi TaxID=300641 RepID=A0AAV2TGR3_CALDB
MSGLGPRFISEKDVETRKKNQEAAGVVEEPYDGRSLYERLQVEKERKQEEYEAANAFKNRVHRLDEEEVEYLQTLAAKRHKIEMENEKEVEKLIKEAQAARPVCSSSGVSESVASRPLPSKTMHSQRALLVNAVKRKSSVDPFTNLLPKRPRNNQEEIPVSRGGELPKSPEAAAHNDTRRHATGLPTNGALHAVGVLPGLANYSSSDSDELSDSDSESTDVEDAACTLLEVAATRGPSSKSPSSEEG